MVCTAKTLLKWSNTVVVVVHVGVEVYGIVVVGLYAFTAVGLYIEVILMLFC